MVLETLKALRTSTIVMAPAFLVSFTAGIAAKYEAWGVVIFDTFLWVSFMAYCLMLVIEEQGKKELIIKITKEEAHDLTRPEGNPIVTL